MTKIALMLAPVLLLRSSLHFVNMLFDYNTRLVQTSDTDSYLSSTMLFGMMLYRKWEIWRANHFCKLCFWLRRIILLSVNHALLLLPKGKEWCFVFKCIFEKKKMVLSASVLAEEYHKKVASMLERSDWIWPCQPRHLYCLRSPLFCTISLIMI